MTKAMLVVQTKEAEKKTFVKDKCSARSDH